MIFLCRTIYSKRLQRLASRTRNARICSRQSLEELDTSVKHAGRQIGQPGCQEGHDCISDDLLEPLPRIPFVLGGVQGSCVQVLLLSPDDVDLNL